MSVLTFPRTLADQNRKIVVLVDPVEDLEKITLDELTDESVIEASCRTTQADTRFAPTDSETLSEPAVCEDAGAETFGASQYEGMMGLFRFFDEETPGQADPEGDILYEALRFKGTEIVVVERHVNKKWDEDFEAGDEIRAFRVETDNFVPATEQHVGYIKGTIKMAIKAAALNAEVVSGSGSEK